MKPIAISLDIAAPLEKVFQTIGDIADFSQAVPAIKKIEFLSGVKRGVGTRFRETRMMNGREISTELEVTEFVDNESIRYVSDAGGTIWDTVFTVAPASSEESGSGNSTVLAMHMDVRPYKLLARGFNFFIRGMVVSGVQADMNAVKIYCEK